MRAQPPPPWNSDIFRFQESPLERKKFKPPGQIPDYGPAIWSLNGFKVSCINSKIDS